MVLGYVLLALALALTVLANVLFSLAKRPDRSDVFKAAQWFATFAAVGVVSASASLIYLIANHHFEIGYVAEYSARRSNQWYLLAAFWGGQEGSLLLWGLWTSILGAVLAFRGGGQDKTTRVWPIWGVVQVFLIGLILLKCPFALGKGPVPSDGKGLNPLLENMWMVIHPPILFLGFASTLAPFVWTVYGLIYRDWDGWSKRAFSWTLFSFSVLGLGLSLGGYWAYETLGWGGFWAWDPVENSSLVPWLFLTALLHGIPIQHKNGGFKVSNLLLGGLPFATMFYGTFLTRTGILADFSVHSFSSLGKDGFYIMLTGVSLAFLVPIALLLWNLKRIPKPAAYERVETREFGYFLATMTLGLIGLIVVIGMSAPLITKLWLAKGAAAQQSFYNQATYPLAILLTVAMAATPYFAWRSSDVAGVRKRLLWPYAGAILLSVVMAGFAMYGGLRKPYQVLLFATSVFAVLANILLILPRLRVPKSRKTVGGFVAHAGAGLLIAGVMGLITFSQHAERVMLIKNFPVTVLGYKLTYLGNTTQPYDRDHNAIRIRIEKNGRMWEGRPRFYFAPWENKDTVFGNPPAILPSVYNVHSASDLPKMLPWNNPFPLGDIYLAFSDGPYSLGDGQQRPLHPNSGFSLKPNGVGTFEEYAFQLQGVRPDEQTVALLSHGNEEMAKGKPLTFVAEMGVSSGYGMAVVKPSLTINPLTGEVYSHPVAIPGPKGEQVMLNFLPPTEEEFRSPDPFANLHFQTINAPDVTEHIFIDLSTKPLIGLVWFGTLLYTVGGFIAYRRRAVEQGLMKGDTLPETAESAPTA